MTSLEKILESCRTETLSVRELGTAFENLVKTWLLVDPVQSGKFAGVETFSEWAERHRERRNDVGIDLVATRHDGGYTAIQCKQFATDHRIRKEDIDSFLSMSGKKVYSERLIVETTDVPWSEHAERMLTDQSIPVYRIGLRTLLESRVDWSAFEGTGEIRKAEPKTLRRDQEKAVAEVTDGLANADRGKLIMACGTGKTLTGLRIAERMAGESGLVLYLVPSLALMSQTVPEWCADARLKLTAFAVCSDSQVGKRRRKTDDAAEIEVTDLALPATTDAIALVESVTASGDTSMRVVFATYQSISVIAKAQTDHGLPDFDLIICDEAHRTTGVRFPGEKTSHFVKVHDNSVVRGRKRLYMTATPRIYGDTARSKARDVDATLASMDDPDLYGELLYHYGFSTAVEKGILADYRVIVLAMDEAQVSRATQKRLANANSELQLDDVTRIVGCWKALAKVGLEEEPDNRGPMRRALAFCNSIANSKLIRDEFRQVVADYRENADDHNLSDLVCEVEHVDGTFKARERGKLLDWLEEDAGGKVCRILSNARCLTEGVDVPALDAILFLHPRKSQIDVVQAVGRVMRQTPDRTKKRGYVILPVGIPPGVPAEVALGDNERYRVIWQVLNALRAHDERLNAVINQGGLGQDVSDRIAVVDGRAPAHTPELRAMTAVVENLPSRPAERRAGIGEGGGNSSGSEGGRTEPIPMVIDEFSRAVMAKVVEKCGTRVYWEDWAKDVARIAERHITRIRTLVDQEGSDARSFFQDFLKELKDDLNESITEQDAIEMLAQHLITRPVFQALFANDEFVRQNAVSVAMQEVLSVIDENQVEREAKDLAGFYASVRNRAQGLTDPKARQELIVQLYDKFFRNAFPMTTQKLGIVYTPVQVVDFIIRSVNDVLEDEFGQTLGSRGVHILDPFVGTGTFITRLLQSGLIAPEDIERKYREEIHANDIILLAYYIAAINIETVFHAESGRKEYLPFGGICLTDTFALHERDDLLSFYMKENTDRRERQKNLDIRVIMGNPPYSVGQKRANQAAQNVSYPHSDNRIRTTYAKRSLTSTKQALYDSYIRAIRWGSDRLGEAGVMAYVTNAGWIDGNAMDGMRKCLMEEFSSIHVFHLRGNQRTQGELSRKEGGKIFGGGSRAPIAISIFVKNTDAKEHGRILFHDIGNYLDQKQKLDIIRQFGSIRGIRDADQWTRIRPNAHGDWLDQRDSGFEQYIKIGDKKNKAGKVVFSVYSGGLQTSREAWCVNPSRESLGENLQRAIRFYNYELERVRKNHGHEVIQTSEISNLLDRDEKRFKWDKRSFDNVRRGKRYDFDPKGLRTCMYRPFTKRWTYMNRDMNWSLMQLPRIFPNGGSENHVIAVTGKGGRSEFSALMMDTVPILDTIEKGQCFPFWLYEKPDREQTPTVDLLEQDHQDYIRRHAITDWGLRQFREKYSIGGASISRWDAFHYLYGLLHSEDYRKRYAANLARELPRIPLVKSIDAFTVFRDAGKRLGELHVGYESVKPWAADVDIRDDAKGLEPEELYRVTQMKHPGTGRSKDWSTVIYNPHITIREIPAGAWEYVINGKPALSWVMERQCMKTDKESGIVSDANRYAIETVCDPRYPLDLFLRMITVSMETIGIVNSLPELDGEIQSVHLGSE